MKWKPPFRGHSGTLAHARSVSFEPLSSPRRPFRNPVSIPAHPAPSAGHRSDFVDPLELGVVTGCWRVARTANAPRGSQSAP